MAAGRREVTPAPVFVHASAVVVGEAGVLIEGASGSGKSSLAEALVVEAARAGQFGRLVGDDRVGLEALHGRLVARPHPAIAGLIERWGTGLVAVPYEPACVLALVVQLVPRDALARLPARSPDRDVMGVILPLLLLPLGDGAVENSRRVLLALACIPPHCTKPF